MPLPPPSRLHPPGSGLHRPQVSFQHELYPVEPVLCPVALGVELEEQPLSRQVFIVQELEIRDRLASSRINKFLYLHTSERMPRRAHSNMVLQAVPPHLGGEWDPTVTHIPGLLVGLWPALREQPM